MSQGIQRARRLAIENESKFIHFKESARSWGFPFYTRRPKNFIETYKVDPKEPKRVVTEAVNVPQNGPFTFLFELDHFEVCDYHMIWNLCYKDFVESPK